MEKIGLVLTYLVVVSVAAERFVQILRGLPLFSKMTKTVYYQILAALFGFVICLIEPPDWDFIKLNTYLLSAMVGLAVSGGSGVWHDFLEAVQDFKKK